MSSSMSKGGVPDSVPKLRQNVCDNKTESNDSQAAWAANATMAFDQVSNIEGQIQDLRMGTGYRSEMMVERVPKCYPKL